MRFCRYRKSNLGVRKKGERKALRVDYLLALMQGRKKDIVVDKEELSGEMCGIIKIEFKYETKNPIKNFLLSAHTIRIELKSIYVSRGA